MTTDAPPLARSCAKLETAGIHNLNPWPTARGCDALPSMASAVTEIVLESLRALAGAAEAMLNEPPPNAPSTPDARVEAVRAGSSAASDFTYRARRQPAHSRGPGVPRTQQPDC